MASIRIASVWKKYGDVDAVRDLTLECPQGEMLALLGPSGCGKSSTLKMVAGIETITGGEIFFDDRPVSRLTPGARDIAMVFEDYALYPHLTVRQNISFPLSVRGIPRRDRDKRVDEVLAILGLAPIAGSGVRGLSGGAQQRVSIGRALVRDPELILFDEPLSHLDGDQKVQLRGEIKRLQSIAGTTSILVTHDQTEAIAMADRIAVMNLGELQQVGPPEDLYSRPANLFVAEFIGEPPMNLLPVTSRETTGGTVVQGHGWHLDVDKGRAAALAKGKLPTLTIGIRPEHLRVRREDGSGATGEVRADVYYREPRGDTDILTLRLFTDDGLPSDQMVTAEIPGPSSFRAGEKAMIAIRPEHVHLFAGDTGRRIEALAG